MFTPARALAETHVFVECVAKVFTASSPYLFDSSTSFLHVLLSIEGMLRSAASDSASTPILTLSDDDKQQVIRALCSFDIERLRKVPINFFTCVRHLCAAHALMRGDEARTPPSSLAIFLAVARLLHAQVCRRPTGEALCASRCMCFPACC
jgi:hypothetical protein